MAYATSLCRRRWARRGRGLADFVFGFALTGLSHILVHLYRFGSWTVGCVLRAARRHRQIVALSAHADGLRPNAAATGSQGTSLAAFTPVCEKPGVRFNNVAGLEDAKREIMLRLVLPLHYPEQAKRFGVRQGGGLLLYGSPGTGKTLLAKAVATEVDASFFHIRPSDIMSGQVGQAEKNVCRLFQTLRQEKRAVLFIDEIESLVPSRRRNGSTIMQRVISQFLGEVDGLSTTRDGHILLLIGATNEPDMIDPAMLRPGRFDVKILVGPPDAIARHHLLRLALNGRSVSADVSLPRLVEVTEGQTGAEMIAFVQNAADRAFLRSIAPGAISSGITMSDFVQRSPATNPSATMQWLQESPQDNLNN